MFPILKRISIFYLLATGSVGMLFAQDTPFRFSTGCLIDSVAYAALPVLAALGSEDGELPPAYSLKQYCPKAGNQGSFPNCTTWACAYSALTILHAHTQQEVWQASSSINENALSPYFPYLALQNGDCERGVYVQEVLNFLKEAGSPPLQDYPYDAHDLDICQDSLSSPIFEAATPYRLTHFEAVKDAESPINLLITKESIADHKPVVLGVKVYESMLEACLDSPTWNGDVSKRAVDNGRTVTHALTIVGYDDHYFGENKGGVEVVNSWGNTWGKDGFLWIRYKDLEKITLAGFSLSIDPLPELPDLLFAERESQLPNMHNFTGTIEFRTDNGEVMPFAPTARLQETDETDPLIEKEVDKNPLTENEWSNPTLQLQDTYLDRQWFSIYSSVQQNSFVYVIAPNETETIEAQMMVVFDSSESIPIHENQFLQRLKLTPDPKATDAEYLYFFLSATPLDIEKIARKLRKQQGNYQSLDRHQARLTKVLGKQAVPSQQLDFKAGEQLFFSANLSKNGVLPLVVAIKRH